MMPKPLIYVAGPYTAPDPVINVQRACRVAEQVRDMGGVPIVPHLSHLWHLVSPHEYDWWMELDFDLLDHCSALFRIPGESSGADRELLRAGELEIPIFLELGALRKWIAGADVRPKSNGKRDFKTPKTHPSPHQADLRFDLSSREGREEHAAALQGGRVVMAINAWLEQWMRPLCKYGAPPERADIRKGGYFDPLIDGADWARQALLAYLEDEGVDLDVYS